MARPLFTRIGEAGHSSLLEPTTPGYPAQLHKRAGHPALHVLGRIQPLNHPGIGLCGSRNGNDVALDYARAAAILAAAFGVPMVSGYARGSDTAAHVRCIEAGGHTTAVLAEGISRFRLRREYDTVLEDWDAFTESMTVISQFRLDAPWSPINAMQRNKTVCGLSGMLVAIDPGERGGTLNAAQEALRQQIPVVIALSSSDQMHHQIERLVGRGGLLVSSERELCDTIKECFKSECSSEPNVQATLFD